MLKMQFKPRHSLDLLVILLLSTGCRSDPDTLKDFTSDRCSLFPDRSLINSDDWCDCCLKHDIAYWQGGTERQRLEADQRLRECVLNKTGDAVLAETMYQGVRFGGSPYFYNWYRWGYGWSYERKYHALTLEEQRLVSDKLVAYYKETEGQPGLCDSDADIVH
jgi:hypothetical protein